MFEIKQKKGIWYSVILIVLIAFGMVVLVDVFRGKSFFFRSQETGSVVRESTLPGYNYEISDGEYSAYFKGTLSKEGAVKYIRNDVEISFQPVEMRYVSASSSRYLQPISYAKNVPAKVGDDTITFENVFKGVDFVYEYTPETLKERIILKDASTFFSPHPKILANNPALELQFIFDFKNSDLVIAGEKWDKASQKKTNQSLSFRNFKLEPAFLRDANGKVTELEYEVKRSGKSFFVTVKVPYSALKDGAFPLEIDPSITATQETTAPAAEPGEGDILAPPAPTDAVYTKFSMRRCSADGGTCNTQIFPNAIALPNEQGEYRPFREVVKTTTKDGQLKVEWNDKSITFAPYIMHGNKKYREKGAALLSLTPDLPQSIALTNRKKEHIFSYEYDLGFANMQNYKSDLKEAGLEIIDIDGFSKRDIEVTPDGLLLPDEILFSWEDAKEEGYAISLSRDKIFASNVAGKDSFIIDPVISMSTTEDVYLDVTSLAPETPTANTIFMKFNLTSIPSNATITMAEVVLNATGITGLGANLVAYNCTTEWTEGDSVATISAIPCTNTGNSTSVTATGFKLWNVTSAVIGMYSGLTANVTIKLNSTHTTDQNTVRDTSVLQGGDRGLGNYATFKSVEDGTDPPRLNVTYTLPPAPYIGFVSPTPDNNTINYNFSFYVNVSIGDPNIRAITYIFNNTNFTLYNNSLILMYNFDNRSELSESNTLIKDLSIWNHTGTAFGGGRNKPNITGKYHGGWELSGGGATGVNITSQLYSYPMTISVWVRAHNLSFGPIIYSAREAADLNGPENETYLALTQSSPITGNGQVSFVSITNSTTHLFRTISVGLVVEQWYYITIVFDSTYRMYVNGTQVDSFATTVTPSAPMFTNYRQNMYLGRPGTSALRWFNGTIDELRIWNRSLTQQEIQQNYLMNLHKFNSTGWNLEVNQSLSDRLAGTFPTGLPLGNYTYYATAKNDYGYENTTGMYNIIQKGIYGCTTIDAPGEYTINASINANRPVCIDITANNVTLNCQEFTLDGIDNATTNYGISVNRSVPAFANVTIQNCILTDFNIAGIYLGRAKNNTVMNINSSSNPASGISLLMSNSSTITNITAKSNTLYGVFLTSSALNTITNITANSNANTGIFLSTSSALNTITNSTTNSNSLYGVRIDTSHSNTLSSITANSNTLDGILLTANSNNFSSITASSNIRHGVYISYALNNTLSSLNSTSNFRFGVLLDGTSGNNTITFSNIENNTWGGIKLEGTASRNKFYNNFFNNTRNANFSQAIVYNQSWNTSNQAGARIFSAGTNISGNFWANWTSGGSGFSQTCADADTDGFCDVNYTLNTSGSGATFNADYLPYSDEYVAAPSDSDLPVIEFISPTPANSTNTTATTIDINATVVDATSNVGSCYLSWKGLLEPIMTNYTMTKTANGGSNTNVTCNYTLSSLTDDLYTYKVIVNDTIPNGNQTNVRQLRVDTTPPSSSFTFGIPYNYSWQVDDFVANVSFSDAASGLTTCGYYMEESTDGSTWTSAANSLDFSCNAPSFTKSITGAVGTGVNDCDKQTTDLKTPSCRIAGTATDEAGNSANSSWRYFRIDYTLPVPVFDTPTPGNGSSISQQSVIGNVSLTENNAGTLYGNWNGTQIPSTSALVAWFPFSEAGGNVTTSAINGWNGTVNGTGCLELNCNANSGWNGSGKMGTAMQFDGIDDVVMVPHSAPFNFSLNDNYSVAVWVRIPPNSAQNQKDILTKWGFPGGGGYPISIRTNTDGTVACRMYNGSSSGGNPVVTTTTALSNNAWHNVVCVYGNAGSGGNGDMKIYSDGALEATTSTLIYGDAGSIGTSSYLHIGGRGTTSFFNGTIDEVMIWNRSLSAVEIADLYNLQAWQFNKSAVTDGANQTFNITHIDAAGNKNFTETRTINIYTQQPSQTTGETASLNGTNYTAANVTLYWNAVANTEQYRVYYTSNLPLGFANYTNVTGDTFWTDVNASASIAKFYRVAPANAAGANHSATISGKVDYAFQRNAAGTGNNWIGLPVNSSALVKASDVINETGFGVPNSTMITRRNATTQVNVQCSDYNCPDPLDCTVGSTESCNFNLVPFEGYQVDTNASSPSLVRWTIAGLLPERRNVTLRYNHSTSIALGFNWVTMWANTSLINANSLLNNISAANVINNWNETMQRVEGYVQLRGGRGRNFPISIYKGYEIHVTATANWTPV